MKNVLRQRELMHYHGIGVDYSRHDFMRDDVELYVPPGVWLGDTKEEDDGTKNRKARRADLFRKKNGRRIRTNLDDIGVSLDGAI